MNPWALVVIGLGILIIIIGVKGSQHSIVSALVNKPPVNSQKTTTAMLRPGTVTAL